MPMEISLIWLGDFPSEEYLREYFDENYDEEDDDAPMNKFAEDQGESFYNHDWLEWSYNDSGNLRHLMIHHSYSTDYIEEVMQLATKKELSGINTFIMADKSEFSSPQSIEGETYSLYYIGEFKCSI